MKIKDAIVLLQQRDQEEEVLQDGYGDLPPELVIYALEEGAGQWQNEATQLASALRFLVELKEIHDNADASDLEKAYYNKAKPLAWNAAKKMLNELQAGELSKYCVSAEKLWDDCVRSTIAIKEFASDKSLKPALEYMKQLFFKKQ